MLEKHQKKVSRLEHHYLQTRVNYKKIKIYKRQIFISENIKYNKGTNLHTSKIWIGLCRCWAIFYHFIDGKLLNIFTFFNYLTIEGVHCRSFLYQIVPLFTWVRTQLEPQIDFLVRFQLWEKKNAPKKWRFVVSLSVWL